jgi:ATP-dependent helicase/nuclease subunit A
MSAPLDQPQRDRFCTELDRNFSIVASAGSGKTRAITDRILALATSPHACEWLPTLVVVTFTNRAADEMQQRARQCILEAGLPLEVLAAFNRAFFGTIHSFCVKLLRQHGHHLGLPGALDLLTDDNAQWLEFFQRHTRIDAGLTEAQLRCLLRLAPVRHLMELGRAGGIGEGTAELGEFPALDFAEVYAVVGKGSAKRTVAAVQECLRLWEGEWQSGTGYLPRPDCGTTAAEFVAAWEAALGPMRGWVQRGALCGAAEIARAYRDFRLGKGAMNYDDQIALAGALLREPEAARRIREKQFRVILDEAQDTDPAQFAVLLEITRPPAATGAWLETRAAPPRPGHFCMVGDFQQSIFGARADLAQYRRVHDTLLASGAGEALEFSVTFRLDAQAMKFINAGFPGVLDGAEGQVDYVQLNPRPDLLPGQVVRCDLGELPMLDGWKDWQRARFEAQQLAEWLRAQDLKNLRAKSWSDVAVLCPRKGWFPALRDALRVAGFDVQLQSERDLKGDSPAYAWFTALVVIMAEPHHSYEIVGVLREVFGVSDHDLAMFAEGFGDRFHIAGATTRRGIVGERLNLLTETRDRVRAWPLFSALEEVVRATHLRARLQALPDAFGDLDAELTELLTLAAAAEAGKKTLAVFAEELRIGFSATRDVRTTRPNAIQLITCHKAKGSEWQAVIIPFLGRNIVQRSGNYPRLLRHPQSGELRAALDKSDGAEWKELLDQQGRHELERLFYVALTRAKHTLVLVDDRELFAGKNGTPKNAAARLLRCATGEANAAALAALPATTTSCSATQQQQIQRTDQRGRELAVEPLPAIDVSGLRIAQQRAGLFLKRNPSALAEAALAEADPAAYAAAARRVVTGPNSGQLYGTWWHEFAERLDWSAEPASWDAIFDQLLPNSPDNALSRHEWKLLRSQLAKDCALTRALTAPAVIAHAEMPFLWAMSERECLDGIMDLAAFDSVTGSWMILDWKTNRVTKATLPALRAHYLPQLSAYWQAAREMLAAPVTAGIFSTALGQWLPYEVSDLASAWEKLRTAPAEIEQALREE